MKTELVWEGKEDEYGKRRTVDIAGCAMPLKKIETIDEPASRAQVQGSLLDPVADGIGYIRDNVTFFWGG